MEFSWMITTLSRPVSKVMRTEGITGNRLTRGGGSENSGSGVFLYYATATLNANEISQQRPHQRCRRRCGIVPVISSRVQNNIITGNSPTNRRWRGPCELPGFVTFSRRQNHPQHDWPTSGAALKRRGCRPTVWGPVFHLLNTILWGDTTHPGKEYISAVWGAMGELL